jgi:hypothetical protein
MFDIIDIIDIIDLTVPAHWRQHKQHASVIVVQQSF